MPRELAFKMRKASACVNSARTTMMSRTLYCCCCRCRCRCYYYYHRRSHCRRRVYAHDYCRRRRRPGTDKSLSAGQVSLVHSRLPQYYSLFLFAFQRRADAVNGKIFFHNFFIKRSPPPAPLSSGICASYCTPCDL